MELEEAIDKLNDFKTIKVLYGDTFAMHIEQLKKVQEAIETVLKAQENSIPKKKIEDKIEQCQNYFRTTYVPNYDGLIFESQKEKYISVINERERKIAQIKILQELLEDK